jgi:hypothetical protein
LAEADVGSEWLETLGDATGDAPGWSSAGPTTEPSGVMLTKVRDGETGCFVTPLISRGPSGALLSQVCQ